MFNKMDMETLIGGYEQFRVIKKERINSKIITTEVRINPHRTYNLWVNLIINKTEVYVRVNNEVYDIAFKKFLEEVEQNEWRDLKTGKLKKTSNIDDEYFFKQIEIECKRLGVEKYKDRGFYLLNLIVTAHVDYLKQKYPDMDVKGIYKSFKFFK